ncbi:hypothetical protein E2C01_098527 [Portunus trituberculatus]|uniref:Uncharacterized protein n=1 Tax=Portunus trituberculatus TaxID=210409 RepID=A0A5B7KCB7_PORTR|nr:hypothetical protein [Portunus trituberculatus]
MRTSTNRRPPKSFRSAHDTTTSQASGIRPDGCTAPQGAGKERVTTAKHSLIPQPQRIVARFRTFTCLSFTCFHSPRDFLKISHRLSLRLRVDIWLRKVT